MYSLQWSLGILISEGVTCMYVQVSMELEPDIMSLLER